jgi:hypothetical protein
MVKQNKESRNKTNLKISYLKFISVIYLGLSKSSGGDTFFSYRKLGKIFLFYEQIERLSLYFSMLFDNYSTGIITIKFR